MKRLICALTLLVVLFGCGSTVKTRNDILDCPAPDKPKYQQLDNATHIGSDKNLIFLMNDLNMMKLYTQQQNATIECFKRQVIQQEKK